MASTFKIQLADDIRRLNLSQLTSYPEFVKLVRSVYNIPELNGIQLSYQDEDKDWINIRSDMDLAEARHYATQFPSFKISVLLSAGVPAWLSGAGVSYPQNVTEASVDVDDSDLTNSFAELMSSLTQDVGSTQKSTQNAQPANSSNVAAESACTSLPAPIPVHAAAPSSGAPKEAAEEQFHQSLDELAAAQNGVDAAAVGVLDSVENKFKQALAALVEFMESLHLDQKVKRLVTELEPHFAAFEQKVIQPLNDLGSRASGEIQGQMSTFQAEVNQLKQRLQQRLEELKSKHINNSAPEASAPVPEALAAPAPQNAIEDLQKLEEMGFTDRRRNLELLAQHRGDINAVVNQLLV